MIELNTLVDGGLLCQVLIIDYHGEKMNYQTARKILSRTLETSFSKTKFSKYELRKQSLIWAINLPSGKNYESRIENLYFETYKGSIIKFGKPGKESKRKRPNPWDMKPTLYEMRNSNLLLTEIGFDFLEMLIDIRTKINEKVEAGHVLLTCLYRSGILIDHDFKNDKFCYEPNVEIFKWLDKQYENIGTILPSELIPMYDAIMFNDDVKVYLNNEKYQSRKIDPNGPRGRINTMGAIFAVCATEEILSRVKLADLLIRGRGTPRIFSREFEYGGKLIIPMTGGIVYYPENQKTLF